MNALRERLAFSQLVMEHAADAVFLLNEEGRTVYANPAAERMFGWSKSELEGRKLHEVVHDRHPGRPRPIRWRIARSGGSSSAARASIPTRTPSSTRTGRPVPVACSNAPVVRDGAVEGGVLIVRDISEARRAQQALAESEARFRNMADSAPVMMWVTDPDGHCTYLNRRWYEFTGQTPGQGEGLGWLDAVHPDDRGDRRAGLPDRQCREDRLSGRFPAAPRRRRLSLDDRRRRRALRRGRRISGLCRLGHRHRGTAGGRGPAGAQRGAAAACDRVGRDRPLGRGRPYRRDVLAAAGEGDVRNLPGRAGDPGRFPGGRSSRRPAGRRRGLRGGARSRPARALRRRISDHRQGGRPHPLGGREGAGAVHPGRRLHSGHRHRDRHHRPQGGRGQASRAQRAARAAGWPSAPPSATGSGR